MFLLGIREENAQALQNFGGDKQKRKGFRPRTPIEDFPPVEVRKKVEFIPSEPPAPEPHKETIGKISQTRIIDDISKRLENNMNSQLGQIREQMNEQQQQFRSQIENLKVNIFRFENSAICIVFICVL